MTKLISGLSLAAMAGVILAGCSAADAPIEPAKDAATEAIETTSEPVAKIVKEAAELAPNTAEVNETRSADSHTHGAATLALVLEDGTVTAELETPLYNVLGFEHVAETEAQKAAVKKAEKVLATPAPLFVFNKSANCVAAAETVSVELGLDGHDDHDHDDHKNHDDHKDHDDHHDENHEGHAGHKDVVLSFEFTCQNPDALTEVTVNLFEHFENLTELELVYLGPNTQKQAELSAANSRASLTR